MKTNSATRATRTGSKAGARRGSVPKRAAGAPHERVGVDAGDDGLQEPAAGVVANTRDADADAILKQFRVIFRSVKKHFQVIERSCGVGGSQLWALATIVSRPGIRVSELAVALSVHQSTASNLIEQMVRIGMIVRERDAEDQRVVRLSATPRGAALLARAPQPLIGVLPDALSNLDATALAQLREALDRLLTVMQVRDESATHTPLADI